MSGGTPARTQCAVCRASIKGTAESCWKCGTGLDRASPAPEVVDAECVRSREPQLQFNESSFSIATLLMITTLIAACLAIGVAAPGIGIVMAIIALPPLIRTLMLVQRKKKVGQRVSNASKFGLYMGSLAVTVIVIWVTVSASALAFCFSCIAALNISPTRSGLPENGIVIIAAAFGLAVFGTMIWLFSKWIRARWKRDLGT